MASARRQVQSLFGRLGACAKHWVLSLEGRRGCCSNVQKQIWPRPDTREQRTGLTSRDQRSLSRASGARPGCAEQPRSKTFEDPT